MCLGLAGAAPIHYLLGRCPAHGAGITGAEGMACFACIKCTLTAMSKPAASPAHRTLSRTTPHRAPLETIRALDDRVSQLEAQVRDLQKQVDRGAAGAPPTGAPKSRAEGVLEEFRRTHTDWYVESEAQGTERAARSEQARQSWIKDGLLVPVEMLAGAWNRSRQALEHACKREELFSVKINNRRLYPAVFTRLAAEDVARVNRALAGGDAVSKLLFWHRGHGGLGGGTIEEALLAGQVARAEELAQGLAREAGWQQSVQATQA